MRCSTTFALSLSYSNEFHPTESKNHDLSAPSTAPNTFWYRNSVAAGATGYNEWT